MSTTIPPLSAQTLLIEGPDADGFVHTQFSSDTKALTAGHWQFSAWLDAQGRVRALFHLARLTDQRWMLLLRGGDAQSLERELRKYVFRSRVMFQSDATRFIVDDQPAALYLATRRDDAIVLGCGDHSIRLSATDVASDRWRLKQIRAGWPWLPPATMGKFLPPSLSLYRLEAVALDKGCYPGQEIVARLHYRGGNKRHLFSVELSQEVLDGTVLQTAERSSPLQLLAVARTASGAEALAVIQEEPALEVTTGLKLTADDGTAITIHARWPS